MVAGLRLALLAGLLLGPPACASWPGTDGPGVDSPLVVLDDGSLLGAVDEGILVFRGIPYAAPPVGDLRFRPPQRVEPWSGDRDATRFGPICPQPAPGAGGNLFVQDLVARAGLSWWRRMLVGRVASLSGGAVESEDCLTLNVWAPAKKGGRFPVMVWLHGGGHAAGSGAQIPRAGLPYARRGIVLVSINYRLGLLGFLAHPALAAESEHGSAGNYGMLDQIEALRWVERNVHRFGGDPERVTIFGESAGAHSVGQLMASPLARGLFHAAIAQSGTGTHQHLRLREQAPRTPAAESAGERILAQLGQAGAADPAAALRSATVEELRAAAAADPGVFPAFHPNVDGWVLPDSTARIFQEGKQAAVPLALGVNRDEGTLLLRAVGGPVMGAGRVGTVRAWKELLRQIFGADASVVDRTYPVRNEAGLQRASERLLGDSLFGAPAFFAARAHAGAGHPTYLYHLTRVPPGPRQTAGAYHGLDLSYVFGAPFPLFPWSAEDEALARSVADYWSSFAREGVPRAEKRVEWTPFDPQEPRWLELGDEVAMRPVAPAARYELLARHLVEPPERAPDAEAAE